MRWRENLPNNEIPQLRAAQYQHAYVIRIRKAMIDSGSSGRKYAADSLNSYDRLMKVLRGETILRIEDLADADVLLGPVTEFGIAAQVREQEELREQEEAEGAVAKEAARQRNIGRRGQEDPRPPPGQ